MTNCELKEEDYLMNEYKKLGEAKYFRSKMEENKFKRNDFINNLSAFLSSSRTIFQYAIKEIVASEINIRKIWYDKKISESVIFKFFRDKRDLNIHERPIQANATYKVQTKMMIRFIDATILKVEDGNIISKYESSNSIKTNQKKEINEDIDYYFDDWEGNENLLVICDNYINEIESFINEGVQLGYITG